MRRFLQILAVLLISFTRLQSQSPGKNYSGSSLLSSGTWFRIPVISEGIYRLDYALLQQTGLTNPANVRIFCNNSGQLSYNNNTPSPDDLTEIPVYITGGDNIFSAGESLLFYAESTHRWIYDQDAHQYKFLRHNYSDTAFYFITSGSSPGRRITMYSQPSGSPGYISTSSDALYNYEVESVNLLKSGREWFQTVLSKGIDIKPAFSDLIVSEKIRCNIRVAARASIPTEFRLYEGETFRKNAVVPGLNLYNPTGSYAQITDSAGYLQVSSSNPAFQIRYLNNGEQGAKGWLDYVRLVARVENKFTGKTAKYEDSRSVATGQVTQFTVKSQVSDGILWDITNPYDVRLVRQLSAGDNIFKAVCDSLRIYMAFTPGNAIIPAMEISSVPNQDLHGSDPADMIIITHPLFKKYAATLAGIHANNSGLTSMIVTPQEIYNEFSGGIPDIVAIRNFLRMKYTRQLGTAHPLRYLLLFGDGSYENKTMPPDNPNFIPTYQSANSNVVTSSFTSDDFYGLLEDGEGEADGTEDIGIGRLPVADTVQAGILISKIRRYLDPETMGDWRNVICLTADDEDGNAHMTDAEGLDLVIREKTPAFNVDKIYLDAFRQVSSVSGQSYPDVNKAINDRINAGCLIFNYVGHGSETGLAHERVVKIEDINLWKNAGKLPLIITATCEFSRYDDIEINYSNGVMTGKPSAGEMILLSREGGAIALMSTTRVVFSAPNFFLNKNIYSCAFERDSLGNTMRLGDIIRIAKNNSGPGANKRNFSLLGDPALRLAYPWHGNVLTDSVNNVAITSGTDSLKALSLITIAGHLESPDGNLLNNFNGEVSPLVYDKENRVNTLANDGGSVMEFLIRNNILFSGKTRATQGKFRFSFIVPRDIDYSFGKGKISYYAHDESSDMNGTWKDVIVGGFSNNAMTDSTGPIIKIYMNDTLFRNGGITDENPILLARLEDKGGINTTGSGIGHDLTGFLDDDRNHSFVLNNYYVNDFDNYMKGTITYNLTELYKGKHTVTLKAWDNFNNSSEETLLFLVEEGGKFVLKNLFNYPNPFRNDTRITCELNRPDTELAVEVNVFNLGGKLIKVIRTTIPPSGYVIPPLTWDGYDDGGNRVAKGMYPYVITISTPSGESARASGRMIIL